MAIEICFPTKHHQGLKESIHLGVFSRVLKQTVLIPKLKKLNANPESSSIYKPLTFFRETDLPPIKLIFDDKQIAWHEGVCAQKTSINRNSVFENSLWYNEILGQGKSCSSDFIRVIGSSRYDKL